MPVLQPMEGYMLKLHAPPKGGCDTCRKPTVQQAHGRACALWRGARLLTGLVTPRGTHAEAEEVRGALPTGKMEQQTQHVMDSAPILHPSAQLLGKARK